MEREGHQGMNLKSFHLKLLSKETPVKTDKKKGFQFYKYGSLELYHLIFLKFGAFHFIYIPKNKYVLINMIN